MSSKQEHNSGDFKKGNKTLFACVKEEGNGAFLSDKKDTTLLSNKRRIRLIASNIKEGRWDEEEHERFLKACYEHGENWQKIEDEIKTRNIVQIRSHAQKYLIKLCKKYSIKLNKKKFKNKKSLHLEWSEKEEKLKKKTDLKSMDKFDKNILDMFKYYDRDYSGVMLGQDQPDTKIEDSCSGNASEFSVPFKKEFTHTAEIIISKEICMDIPSLNKNQPANLIIAEKLVSLHQSNQKVLNNLFITPQNPYSFEDINSTMNLISVLLKSGEPSAAYHQSILYLSKMINNFNATNRAYKSMHQLQIQNVLKRRNQEFLNYFQRSFTNLSEDVYSSLL